MLSCRLKISEDNSLKHLYHSKIGGEGVYCFSHLFLLYILILAGAGGVEGEGEGGWGVPYKHCLLAISRFLRKKGFDISCILSF